MPQIKKALTLDDLPAPPPGKVGWPWTEQSEPVGDRMPDGSEYPRISIVTPSYNQGQFLEETMRSVLLQGYPNLEYIIIDGGSTDETVEIIKKYESFITYWVSEPDHGQSHAINKGLEIATGGYIAWMNSDDCYVSNALAKLSKLILEKKYDFIYGSTLVGRSLSECRKIDGKGTDIFCLKNLMMFFHTVEYIVPSQSVFLSRELFSKIGYLDESLHYCMDLDWFIRAVLEKPLTFKVAEPICFYRVYPDTKTCRDSDKVRLESLEVAGRYIHLLNESDRKAISRLIKYSNTFQEYVRRERPNNLLENLKTIIQFPIESLTDTRFLGFCKRSVFDLARFK